mmetsp:Transcript_50890/g.164745  ORF Transcript_50890/g.164745 Transcript_50890/m.164745 type:complete len:496 (+) Transcript_50890:1099-2586(+)
MRHDGDRRSRIGAQPRHDARAVPSRPGFTRQDLMGQHPGQLQGPVRHFSRCGSVRPLRQHVRDALRRQLLRQVGRQWTQIEDDGVAGCRCEDHGQRHGADARGCTAARQDVRLSRRDRRLRALHEQPGLVHQRGLRLPPGSRSVVTQTQDLGPCVRGLQVRNEVPELQFGHKWKLWMPRRVHVRLLPVRWHHLFLLQGLQPCGSGPAPDNTGAIHGWSSTVHAGASCDHCSSCTCGTVPRQRERRRRLVRGPLLRLQAAYRVVWRLRRRRLHLRLDVLRVWRRGVFRRLWLATGNTGAIHGWSSTVHAGAYASAHASDHGSANACTCDQCSLCDHCSSCPCGTVPRQRERRRRLVRGPLLRLRAASRVVWRLRRRRLHLRLDVLRVWRRRVFRWLWLATGAGRKLRGRRRFLPAHRQDMVRSQGLHQWAPLARVLPEDLRYVRRSSAVLGRVQLRMRELRAVLRDRSDHVRQGIRRSMPQDLRQMLNGQHQGRRC